MNNPFSEPDLPRRLRVGDVILLEMHRTQHFETKVGFPSYGSYSIPPGSFALVVREPDFPVGIEFILLTERGMGIVYIGVQQMGIKIL